MSSKTLLIATMTAAAIGTALTGSSVLADGTSAPANHAAATIHFADLGNIREWRPDGNEALLVESQNGTWYRATFWAPCINLPVSEAIAFVTEPNGSLDAFSSVLVEGNRCWFKTFQQTTEPKRAPRVDESE